MKIRTKDNEERLRIITLIAAISASLLTHFSENIGETAIPLAAIFIGIGTIALTAHLWLYWGMMSKVTKIIDLLALIVICLFILIYAFGLNTFTN